MTRIFWDSNLFIYLFEDNPHFAGRVHAIRRAMLDRGDLLLTGALTVGEVLVKPREEGNMELLARYRRFFGDSSVVTIIPFDLRTAEHYAEIRADRSIAHADAIQLACAAAGAADLFVSNDSRLEKKSVRGIRFISSLARAPL